MGKLFRNQLAFTDRVRKALARAVEEANRLGHGYVGTEHILLGLAADEGGVFAAVLSEFGAAAADIRARVQASVRPGPNVRALGELPYTSRAKRALELSVRAATDLRHEYVGTEHILLGLLAEEKGIAAKVLEDLGLTLDQARATVLGILGGESDGAHRARRDAFDTFRVEIDDASSSSIYEQIVAQVREAVATGALAAGARLPPVRRLADELDIAPGTVARAYGELERLAVVVTEGARGTRVAETHPEAQPESERRETLIGLLRPVAVAAFHMGASAAELRDALEPAMEGILGDG